MGNKRTLSNSGVRVVVTGMGCVTPLGNDLNTTWNNAIEGKSGAQKISLFDASQNDVTFACEVKNFDPEKYLSKKDLRRMDRVIQLGIAASFQAVENAQLLTKGPLDKTRVGTILASGICGIGMIEENHKTAL